MRTARLIPAALLAAACTSVTPAASLPLPSAVAMPTPIVIFVTQPPTPTPSPTATAQAHDITVKVIVSGTPFGDAGTLSGVGQSNCVTRGAYSDIALGMQATIHDSAGTIIGFATFVNDGVSTKTEEGPIGPVPTECTFTTIVHGLPDAPIYSIDAGHRGSVQFSRDELANDGWTAELSLGNQ